MVGRQNGSLKRKLNRIWFQIRLKLVFKLREYFFRIPYIWYIYLYWLGFHLNKKSFTRHWYISWRTGSWKTSLLEQLVYNLHRQSYKKKNCCIIYIDPHWSSVEKLKKSKLFLRSFNRLVYIDPLLRKWFTPCINPFETNDISLASLDLYTNDLVAIFQELIPDSKLSNYMKSLLVPCILTLLLHGWCDLKDLQDFMLNRTSAKWVLEWTRNPVVAHKEFFKNNFMHWAFEMSKTSVYMKLQSLLNSKVFYNFTSWRSTINLEREIAKWKVILVNLNIWSIGEEVSSVLWRFIVAQIKSIALRRHKLPHQLNVPIYCFIDEAEMIVAWGSVDTILKQARKYWLYIILSTQDIYSLRKNRLLKNTVYNNTYTKIVWMNGYKVLLELGKEISVKLVDLLNMKPFEFRVKQWYFMPYKLKTRNIFWRKSRFLWSRWQVARMNNRIIKTTTYYKPEKVHKAKLEERIEDYPFELRQQIIDEEMPKPKFTL